MYGRRTGRIEKIIRKWGVFMSAILKQKLIDIANGFTKYGLWKGGGSSALSEMTDVTFTNLKENDVLKYNGSKWINDDNLQTQINTLSSNLYEKIEKIFEGKAESNFATEKSILYYSAVVFITSIGMYYLKPKDNEYLYNCDNYVRIGSTVNLNIYVHHYGTNFTNYNATVYAILGIK